MTDGIHWEDPPPNVRGDRADAARVLRAFAAALRDRPGEWAAWPTPAKHYSQIASNLRAGGYASFRPPADFEVSASKDVGCWVRYVGSAK